MTRIRAAAMRFMRMYREMDDADAHRHAALLWGAPITVVCVRYAILAAQSLGIASHWLPIATLGSIAVFGFVVSATYAVLIPIRFGRWIIVPVTFVGVSGLLARQFYPETFVVGAVVAALVWAIVIFKQS
jgi:hypothetical protein